MKKYLLGSLLFIIFNLFFSNAWGQTNSVNLNSDSIEKVTNITIDKYLSGYIENNLELKELKLDVEETENNLNKFLIENGIDITVSTGESNLTISDGNIELEASPSLTVKIPKYQNTVIETSIPMTVTTDSDTDTYFNGVGISFSKDLISETNEEYILNIDYFERQVFEAQLAVDTKLISLKSNFWEILYDIYEADKTIKEDSEDLFDNQIDFETIKAQGYSENSSTYRIAELEINENLFTIEKHKRDLYTLLGRFAVDCGLNPDDIKTLPMISNDFYNITLIDFEKYKIDNYIKLEDAIDDYEYNSKLRDIDSNFSLSAGAGYNYTGYSDYSSNSIDDDEGNIITTELSATYGGLTSSIGIDTLVEEPSEPSFTFSVSYDFGTNKIDKLDMLQEEIDRQKELLAIDDAKDSWLEDNLDMASTKETLNWSREQNTDQLNLYKKMYEDSVLWLDQGIISETDLLKAKNSYEIKMDTSILTIIDSIIYNFEVEKLFIGEK